MIIARRGGKERKRKKEKTKKWIFFKTVWKMKKTFLKGYLLSFLNFVSQNIEGLRIEKWIIRKKGDNIIYMKQWIYRLYLKKHEKYMKYGQWKGDLQTILKKTRIFNRCVWRKGPKIHQKMPFISCTQLSFVFFLKCEWKSLVWVIDSRLWKTKFCLSEQ